MAQKRAPLAAHALDDLHDDLTPIRDRREPVAAPSAADELPPPSDTIRTFHATPLGDGGASILDGFSSLQPSAKRERLVPYPIRLPVSQIEALERLKEKRGVVPAQFVRDAVASCLAMLEG